MGETRKHVQVLRVDYECDACGEGVMRRHGLMLDTDLPPFSHACTHCGHRQDFDTEYPYIEWEDYDVHN